MKKLYIEGNYVIRDDNGTLSRYARARSVYTERGGVNFKVLEDLDRGELIIPIADAATWFDVTGLIAFTEATMRTFFLENTGFSLALSPNTALNGDILVYDTITKTWIPKSNSGYQFSTVVDISSAQLLTLETVGVDLLPATGVGKYYSFKMRFEFTHNGIDYSWTMSFIELISGAGASLGLISAGLITGRESRYAEITSSENLVDIGGTIARQSTDISQLDNDSIRINGAIGLVGNPAFGTGTMKVFIDYSIHTIGG